MISLTISYKYICFELCHILRVFDNLPKVMKHMKVFLDANKIIHYITNKYCFDKVQLIEFVSNEAKFSISYVNNKLSSKEFICTDVYFVKYKLNGIKITYTNKYWNHLIQRRLHISSHDQCIMDKSSINPLNIQICKNLIHIFQKRYY